MVAVIRNSHSIRRILNYNENKVKLQNAVCIGARNFPADPGKLSFTMKLNRFVRLLELNPNAKRNSVHISLNFDASEKDMPEQKLMAIADMYLDNLGFGKQPCLVYRHDDAGHPHIHLVTTNIQADGSRIDLHHLAIRKSEPARKMVEEAFGLVRAQGKEYRSESVTTKSVRKAEYGKSQTRAAIQNVLESVLGKYRFTSLAEFNAVLGLYNIRADQGRENSRVHRNGGLLYRILDDKGNPVGVPVKASSFYNSPTLAKLSVKFSTNRIMGQQHKARVKNAIDRLPPAVAHLGTEGLDDALGREGISVVRRENAEGFLYGITFIDHTTGGVFNGSALGKNYSAKQMQERFPVRVHGQATFAKDKSGTLKADPFSGLESMALANPSAAPLISDIIAIARQLTAPEWSADIVPGQWKKRTKKKKRGPSGNL